MSKEMHVYMIEEMHWDMSSGSSSQCFVEASSMAEAIKLRQPETEQFEIRQIVYVGNIVQRQPTEQAND